MRDGNRESEITRIKRDVIKKLYSDPDIIEMLNNSDIDPDCPDTAEFTSIFPFIRIPNVQEEEKCYIGVKLSIPEMRYRDYENKNDVVIKAQLTVAVICHNNMLRVPGQKGNRVDIIGGDIAEKLNFCKDFGFTLNLLSDTEDIMTDAYYSRVQQYTLAFPNNTDGGRKRFR